MCRFGEDRDAGRLDVLPDDRADSQRSGRAQRRKSDRVDVDPRNSHRGVRCQQTGSALMAVLVRRQWKSVSVPDNRYYQT